MKKMYMIIFTLVLLSYGYSDGLLSSIQLQLVKEIKLNIPVYSSPVVVDNIIYFGSRDKNIYAVDILLGSVKWQYKTGNSVDSSPTIYDSMLYVGSKDGYLYCLDLITGKLIWRYKAGGFICSSPIVFQGKVFVGVGYSKKDILAVDIKTGRKVWSYETGQMVYSSPVVWQKLVFCGADDAKIYALDVDTGKFKWSYKTKGEIYFSSPSIKDNILYFLPGGCDETLYALDASTGKDKWQYLPEGLSEQAKECVITSSTVVKDDTVYVNLGYEETYLYAVEANTGKLKWKAFTGKGQVIGTTCQPVVSSNYVFIGSVDKNIYGIDKLTGKVVFQYTTSAPIMSQPVFINNFLYVISTNGVIYIFENVPSAEVKVKCEIPAKTELLNNYPNPFNPESWLPYTIGMNQEQGKVKIKIYNILGQEIRELDLGKKQVGYYVTKDKAAYWDGKDSTGKELSSGMYFYQLFVNNKSIGIKKNLILK